MPNHEHEPPREREPLPYHQAARFVSERAAGRAYGPLQALLGARPDLDLSVFRLLIDQVPHVAVLGQPPPEEVDRRLRRRLAQGEPVTLPPEVLQALAQRRAAAIRQAPWLERHHRPGERL